MSLLISTSIHSSVRRTLIMPRSISGARAAVRRSAIVLSWRSARAICSWLCTDTGMRICEAIDGSSVGSCEGAGADGPILVPDLITDGLSQPPPCTCLLPTCTGLIVRGAPPKASVSASAMIRYLPSFTDEIAYMTTKKASSSVIRSA